MSTKDRKQDMYICPVCADIFSNASLVHCTECDHHYPLDDEKCHNCHASKDVCYGMVPITLSINDVIALSKWSKKNGRKRGMGMVYHPDGSIYEGGIQIK